MATKIKVNVEFELSYTGIEFDSIDIAYEFKKRLHVCTDILEGTFDGEVKVKKIMAKI